MSVVPAAFEAVRHLAYERWGRVPRTERRFEDVATWCVDAFREWRAEGGDRHELADAQIVSMSRSVAGFVVRQLGERRKRAPARTTAEGRAFERLALGTAVPALIEDMGKPVTAARVAAFGGTSQRKAGRALAEHRGTPKRAARMAALRPIQATMLGLVEEMIPTEEGLRIVRLADVAARVWPDPVTEAAAQRQRRKRILDAFAALAPLSVYVVADGDLLAIRRGRRWKPQDAAARLTAAAEAPRSHVSSLPLPRVGGPFWTSIEVRGFVAALRFAVREVQSQDSFFDFLAIQHLVLDGRAVTNLFRMSQRFGHWYTDPAAFFAFAAEGHWRVRVEPAVRSALYELARRIDLLTEDGGLGRPAVDTIAGLLSHSTLGVPLAEHFTAEGRARVAAFRAIIDVPDGEGGWIGCVEALDLCTRMAVAEREGRWTAEPYLRPDCPF